MARKIYAAAAGDHVHLVRVVVSEEGYRAPAWTLRINDQDVVRAGEQNAASLAAMATALRSGVAIVLEEVEE